MDDIQQTIDSQNQLYHNTLDSSSFNHAPTSPPNANSKRNNSGNNPWVYTRTLMLIGLVATLSQWAALSMAAIPFDPRWSTGGLLALLGAWWVKQKVNRGADFKRTVWKPLALTAALCFGFVGLMNSYFIEVVDNHETFSLQPTGRFNLVDSNDRICEPGQDYYGCVEAHRGMYNALCTEGSWRYLSTSAQRTCGQLSSFVDDIQARLRSCGYNCKTQGEKGNWGWAYQYLQPEKTEQSNHDYRTHLERCHFDLGFIQLGTCQPRSHRA